MSCPTAEWCHLTRMLLSFLDVYSGIWNKLSPSGGKHQISIEELETIGVEVRHLAAEQDPRACEREVFLIDSRVCVGVIGKRRSGSPVLNQVWKKVFPCLVISMGTIAPLWIKSGSNSADAPSRGLPLP